MRFVRRKSFGSGLFSTCLNTSVSISQDFSQPFLSPMLSGAPPPPPPLPPPPDELEPPPKPPFADEEEEEEMLLRETCLMSMANKRVTAPEVCVSASHSWSHDDYNMPLIGCWLFPVCRRRAPAVLRLPAVSLRQESSSRPEGT